MTDPQRLASIKSREEKATQGPWDPGHFADDEAHCNCRYVFGNDDRMGAVAEISVSERDDGSDGDNPPPAEARANLEFIAHAREDIPWLLSALEASEVENARLRALITPIECALCAGSGKRQRLNFSNAGTHEVDCSVCNGEGVFLPRPSLSEVRAALTSPAEKKD